MDYDVYGYDNAPNGTPVKKDNTNGWLPILLVLGIAIAFYENAEKWKEAIFNYFLNIFHHPLQLFHFETLLYLFLLIIIFKGIFTLLKKRFN